MAVVPTCKCQAGFVWCMAGVNTSQTGNDVGLQGASCNKNNNYTISNEQEILIISLNKLSDSTGLWCKYAVISVHLDGEGDDTTPPPPKKKKKKKKKKLTNFCKFVYKNCQNKLFTLFLHGLFETVMMLELYISASLPGWSTVLLAVMISVSHRVTQIPTGDVVSRQFRGNHPWNFLWLHPGNNPCPMVIAEIFRNGQYYHGTQCFLRDFVWHGEAQKTLPPTVLYTYHNIVFIKIKSCKLIFLKLKRNPNEVCFIKKKKKKKNCTLKK